MEPNFSYIASSLTAISMNKTNALITAKNICPKQLEAAVKQN